MPNETHSDPAAGGNPEQLAQQLARATEQLAAAQARVFELERELAARRSTEDALWANTAKLRLVLKELPVIIWTADRHLRITSWAASGPAGHQFEGTQTVGQTLPALLGETSETDPALSAAMRANEGQVTDTRFVWNDRVFLLGVEPMWNRQGTPSGHVAVAVDITAPRVLQSAPSPSPSPLQAQQEAEARKMEAVGRLAGGIAHELNNILTGIVGYADLWRLRTAPADPAFEAIDTIQNGAARATRLTQQLLGYARRGKNQNVPVDLTALLRELVATWGQEPGRAKIEMGAALETEVRITGDPRQWRDVFQALLQNAVEATREGGAITVVSDAVAYPQPVALLDADLPPGSYQRITIRDTGQGIAPEHLTRVFEPFYSTRRADNNLGMGLSLAYGVTRNHGGGILIESERGRGTAVHLLFPSAAPAPAPAVPPSPARSRKRIMVVDDEAYVRQTVQQMLIELGYEVVTFEDCAAAVEYYRSHRENVDLVILDLVMPKDSGNSCFAELRRLDPGVKAVLASGFGQDGAVQQGLNMGIAGFLQKPFKLATLRQTLARILQLPE